MSIFGSASDLGIGTWNHGVLGHPQVVDIHAFSGHFALGTVDYQDVQLWVTMSLSHVSSAYLAHPVRSLT